MYVTLPLLVPFLWIASIISTPVVECQILPIWPVLPLDVQFAIPAQAADDSSATTPGAEDKLKSPLIHGALTGKSSVRPKLTRVQLRRKTAITACRTVYYTKYINANVKRPWSIMHALIAYGKETQILYNGRLYNAAEYLCHNGIGDDRRILTVQDGKIKTNVGVGVQGHEGQLLAMFAQTDVAIDEPIMIDGQRFTVRDLIEYEKQTCRAGTELTFKLIGLAHYLDSDATWENDLGEAWSISRLVAEELAQPINGAACGGTHRLMGTSYAIRKRREQGKEIDGHFARANVFISDFQKYAKTFQYADGSFSTRFFEARSDSGDITKKLYTTGHIIEWLVFSLPEDQLHDETITRGIDFITKTMLTAPNHELDIGPRGHALHALALYEQRVFGKSDYKKLTPQTVSMIKKHATRSLTQPASLNGRQGMQLHNPTRVRGLFGRGR